MKIENQVCTMEQALKMKELGISQDSYFSWCGDETQRLMDNGKEGIAVSNWVFIDVSHEFNNQHADHRADVPSAKPFAAAFTVAELGVMLGKNVQDCFYHGPTNMWSQARGMNPDLWQQQAHCYANWLIYLLETKCTTPEKVNTRLKITHDT